MKKFFSLFVGAAFAASLFSGQILSAPVINQTIGDGNSSIQISGSNTTLTQVEGSYVGGDSVYAGENYIGGGYVGGDSSYVGGNNIYGDEIAGNSNSVVGDNNVTAGGDYVNIGSNNSFVFVDLQGYEWAAEAINSFVNRGIIEGIGGDMFAPGEAVTREQFAKMMSLTFMAELEYPEQPTFVDVLPERWSYGYIEGVKDYLTGYVSPISSKMAFYPNDNATREDIAVSLVRVMGLTDANANNPDFAFEKFLDSQLISPGLVKYVSIAAEMGLIQGYSDGYFRPTQGVTRAECVVLLNRVLKQAVASVSGELMLNASVDNTDNPQVVYINVSTETGAKVTVDGQSVPLSPTDDYSMMHGAYKYTFTKEETKAFTVIAEKGDKTSEVTLSATYLVDAPNLFITNCPTYTDSKTAEISGTVDNDILNLTVNGESCGVDSYGNWTKTVQLNKGNNTFIIRAANALGKVSSLERTITLNAKVPVIDITSSNITYSSYYRISGKVTSDEQISSITVNGNSATTSGGYFEYTANLDQEYTEFTIRATTVSGESAVKNLTAHYSGYQKPAEPKVEPAQPTEPTEITEPAETTRPRRGGRNGDSKRNGESTKEITTPTLTVQSVPSTVTTAYVTVSGTAMDNVNKVVSVKVNGETVSTSNGGWSTIVDLKEGVNSITVVAENSAGITASNALRVTYTAPAKAEKPARTRERNKRNKSDETVVTEPANDEPANDEPAQGGDDNNESADQSE